MWYVQEIKEPLLISLFRVTDYWLFGGHLFDFFTTAFNRELPFPSFTVLFSMVDLSRSLWGSVHFLINAISKKNSAGSPNQSNFIYKTLQNNMVDQSSPPPFSRWLRISGSVLHLQKSRYTKSNQAGHFQKKMLYSHQSDWIV